MSHLFYRHWNITSLNLTTLYSGYCFAAFCLSVQGKEPSVRQLALLHFRNTIVLSVKLDDALSRPRARVPPSVTQMLLILQVGSHCHRYCCLFLNCACDNVHPVDAGMIKSTSQLTSTVQIIESITIKVILSLRFSQRCWWKSNGFFYYCWYILKNFKLMFCYNRNNSIKTLDRS